MTELEKAKEALTEIMKYNRIRNDLEAYLFCIGEWGLGILTDKPIPRTFGIDETPPQTPERRML